MALAEVLATSSNAMAITIEFQFQIIALISRFVVRLILGVARGVHTGLGGCFRLHWATLEDGRPSSLRCHLVGGSDSGDALGRLALEDRWSADVASIGSPAVAHLGLALGRGAFERGLLHLRCHLIGGSDGGGALGGLALEHGLGAPDGVSNGRPC